MNRPSCFLLLTAAVLWLACDSKPSSRGQILEQAAAASISPDKVKSEGPNPRYYEVQQHLDEGGSFYLYADVKDVLRDGVAALNEASLELKDPQVTAIVGTLGRIMERLGVYGVQDIGLSSLPEPGGTFLSKSYINIPEGRQGFIQALGGPSHAFETINLAPRDSLAVIDVDFEPARLLELIRLIAQDLAGMVGTRQVDQGLLMLQTKTGLDIQAIIHSLSGNFRLIGTLKPSGAQNTVTTSSLVQELPQLIVGARIKDTRLYDSLLTWSRLHTLAGEETTVGLRRQFTLQSPDKIEWVNAPVIAMQEGYCYFASDVDYLDRVLKKRESQDTLENNDEFKTVSAGLPREGNEFQFVSRHVPEYFQNMGRAAVAAMPQNFSNPGQPNPATMMKIMERLGPKPGPQYRVRINQPTGIQTVSRSNQGGKQAVVAAMIFPAAMMAAIAVPNFLEAQTRSKVSRVKSDMRSMATAIEAYHIDTNAYPGWSTDPQINAFGPLGEHPDLAGRPTFRSDYSRGGPMSLTTPVSYITHFFVDPFSATKGATFNYWTPPADKGIGWIVWSPGPDGVYDITLQNVSVYYGATNHVLPAELIERTFDPTNGTVSGGDIFRVKQ